MVGVQLLSDGAATATGGGINTVRLAIHVSQEFHAGEAVWATVGALMRKWTAEVDSRQNRALENTEFRYPSDQSSEMRRQGPDTTF